MNIIIESLLCKCYKFIVINKYNNYKSRHNYPSYYEWILIKEKNKLMICFLENHIERYVLIFNTAQNTAYHVTIYKNIFTLKQNTF